MQWYPMAMSAIWPEHSLCQEGASQTKHVGWHQSIAHLYSPKHRLFRLRRRRSAPADAWKVAGFTELGGEGRDGDVDRLCAELAIELGGCGSLSVSRFARHATDMLHTCPVMTSANVWCDNPHARSAPCIGQLVRAQQQTAALA
eukprot:1790102-Rhodomonas_salina.21